MIIIPIILSGGAGTRLWPVSREQNPKPFIQLPDGESLLQKTFLRAAALPGVEQVVTVTNRELVFRTEDEYRPVNSRNLPTPLVLEPEGRNTAPAIAIAALVMQENVGEDAILLVLPADHLITYEKGFAEAVVEAAKLAQKGNLVTFGIQPSAPETGYGYIEADGNRVVRFVEKPSEETAREYLASGNFFWNSGMFCFTAGTVLREMETHSPEIVALARSSLLAANKTEGNRGSARIELEAGTFGQMPDISVDYALMEKSEKVNVVACDIGWNDIGSWNAFAELTDADAEGNRAVGRAMFHKSANCYVHNNDRMVAALGLDNLLVVDTPDAVLIANRDQVQDVKHFFGELKKQGNDAYRLHLEAHRPWGTYTVVGEGRGFQVKRIRVKPGCSLSLQLHHKRSEHWVVVAGRAKVVNGESLLELNPNESTYIPVGVKHRLENATDEDLVLVEVQCGEYLGEDDIVRFEDVYGRV